MDVIQVAGTATVVKATQGVASNGNEYVAIWLESDTGKNRSRIQRVRGNAYGDQSRKWAVGDVVRFSGELIQLESKWMGRDGMLSACLRELTLTVPESVHPSAHKYEGKPAMKAALARAASMSSESPTF